MPVTICGPLQIHNVVTNGNVKFGDSIYLSPKDVSKVFAGSGAINIGMGAITNTVVNSTNYIDPNVMDQPNVGNK
jgi:spore germination protein PF